jgi:2-polyprenyl-3-methyl-5-hydroxy-6-metoxy-1,4-benzoquinol methylase
MLAHDFRVTDHVEPTLANVVSQLVTENQFHEPVYQDWCGEIRERPRFHRKQWEFVYTLQALRRHNLLRSGVRGLGFGVGSEPLPAVMAKYGCSVVATEINIERAHEKGWVKGRDVESELNSLNDRGICDEEAFRKLVTYRDVDMNDIPGDLKGFDFVWSCCSLEHVGTMERAVDFIFNSLECLKAGGVAVHTTEYNIHRFLPTVTKGSTIFFKQKHIERLAQRLVAAGHHIVLNLHTGNGRLDRHFDFPPYSEEQHLKLVVSKQAKLFVATSLGLLIRKAS